MAIRRSFGFSVDPQTSEEQIRTILQAYPSDANSTPTGSYRKYGDILQIEMYLTTVTQENIYNTEAKLRSAIAKVTARSVLTTAELGPVEKGRSTPLPETSINFEVPKYGNKDWFDILKDAFTSVQTLVILGIGLAALIIFIRYKRA
jgi:hypothetical protein